MNEEKVTAEDEGKDKALPLNLNRILIVGVAVALVTGGLFLFSQVSSSPGCAGEGACMLYFYTDW
jgi:hypothetical protein